MYLLFAIFSLARSRLLHLFVWGVRTNSFFISAGRPIRVPVYLWLWVRVDSGPNHADKKTGEEASDSKGKENRSCEKVEKDQIQGGKMQGDFIVEGSFLSWMKLCQTKDKDRELVNKAV